MLRSGGRFVTTLSRTSRRSLSILQPASVKCRRRAEGRLFSSEAEYSDSDRQLILQHALQPQTSVSLQALMRTGRGEYLHKTFGETTREKHAATELVLIQVASFLRRELPIRLAHRIQDLEGVPVLREMASVKGVRELYIKSFLELSSFDEKIENGEQEEAFARVVENIYERHSSVLVQMVRSGNSRFFSILLLLLLLRIIQHSHLFSIVR